MIDEKVVQVWFMYVLGATLLWYTQGPLQRRLLDTPAFDQLTKESRLALAPSLQQKERLHIVEAYLMTNQKINTPISAKFAITTWFHFCRVNHSWDGEEGEHEGEGEEEGEEADGNEVEFRVRFWLLFIKGQYAKKCWLFWCEMQLWWFFIGFWFLVGWF